MISEIVRFENIGTPNYITELVKLIHEGSYNQHEINDFFIDRIIDGYTIFDGGLYVLKYIGFVKVQKESRLYIPNKLSHFLKNEKTLQSKFITLFIDKWLLDESFSKIFNQKTVLHDASYNVIVDNAAFGFKYSKLKQLLINFEVFSESNVDNYFSVTKQFEKYFDKTVKRKVQLSLKELEEIQELKNKQGNEAEIFVLNLEKKKFKNHRLVNIIEQISVLNTGAGYDIASIKGNNSRYIDKFIEVKSYSRENPSFYWSNNEVNIAKKEQENYFLYLVDRNEMKNKDYHPMVIQNPYENVFKKYEKKCKSWKFELTEKATCTG